MANQGSIANLKQNVNTNIYTNTSKHITGDLLNTVIQNVIDTLGLGVKDFINVNQANSQGDAYSDAATAREDVPIDAKKVGLTITYLLSDGWHIDQYVGSNISGWTTETNWNSIGPVRVAINTTTGHIDIQIGDKIIPIPSFEDMYQKVDADLGINLVNPQKAQHNAAIVGSSGQIDTSVSSTYWISDYIPVNGQDIIGNLFHSSFWSGGNVYDINKNYIRTIGDTNQYTYQEGDYYVRLSFSSNKGIAAYGTTMPQYEPYTQLKSVWDILNDAAKLKVLYDNAYDLIYYNDCISSSYLAQSSGAVSPGSQSYFVSNYIPVYLFGVGYDLTASLVKINSVASWVAYDSNLNITHICSTEHEQYTYQEGDYYVRYSLYGTTSYCYPQNSLIRKDINSIKTNITGLQEDVAELQVPIKLADVYNGVLSIIQKQSDTFIQGHTTSTYGITETSLLLGSSRRDEFAQCKLVQPNMANYLYLRCKVRNTQNTPSEYTIWISPSYSYEQNKTHAIASGILNANEEKIIELSIDLANLVVYWGFTDKLSLWLQPRAVNDVYAEIEWTEYEIFQLENEQIFTNFGGYNLTKILESIDGVLSSINPNIEGNMLTAPDGNKYFMAVNSNGQIISIPLYPDEVTYIGNSLLRGSGYGMAASDIEHDYYYLINQFLSTKVDNLTVSSRIGVSDFERATTIENAKSEADTIVNSITTTTQLIILQLGDNVSSSVYQTVFLPALLYLVQGLRNKAERARIILVASWYGDVTAIMNTVVNERGVDFVNIVSCRGASSNSHIGAIQKFDSITSRSIDNVTNVTEETNDDSNYNYKLSVEFTVSAVSYTTVLYCNSYDLQNTTLTYLSDLGVVQNAGVASHPGDDGFRKIANKILYDGGFTDIEEYYQ